MNFTKSQTDAIEYGGGKNLLVAAAAGSGKTAVLVERIIRRISDKNDPISVDEVLVLTFTNAAAAEMKNKIAAAIEQRLREDPDNRHLREQSARIAAADISTVHSFARKIISNNIHRTDIPAGFTLIDDNENEMLKTAALSDCLERYYARMDKLSSFADLTLGHGGIKNDNNLRDIILKIYEYSRSMAQPEKWLNNAVRLYRGVYKSGTVHGTEWERAYLEAVKDSLRPALEYYSEIDKLLDDCFPPDHPNAVLFRSEQAMLKWLYESENVNEFIKNRNAPIFGRKKALTKKYSDDPYIAATDKSIKTLRDMAKKQVEEGIAEQSSSEDLSTAIRLMYPRIRTLKNIVLMLSRRHTRLKLERGALDYGDLEHRLIKLIMNKDGSPNEFCRALGSRYKEIYVDEYQDTNNLQDTLFTLLSGGRGNIFMVGDLKQSIYGFRNATPALFLDKYRRYGEGGGGQLFVLSDNFRSRRSVIEPVNELFENIMFKSSSGIDYDENERLRPGADFPNSEDESAYITEIIMTEAIGEKPTIEDKLEAEARAAAERIVDLVCVQKLQVFDKNAARMRDIKFGDIAVLFRGMKNSAPIYERVFSEYSIPVVSDIGGFLNTIEVQTVISFLNIIDNPIQDIPLIAVMRSPIFGFTADELAEIRTKRRKCAFYHAVCAAAENSGKAAAFLNELNRLRKYSKHMGVNELIYKILYDLDYLAAASAMRGGELRRANLGMLLRIAGNFEKQGLNGLFDFMDYLKNAAENADMAHAKPGSGAESAVTMMTIHKSKGLEFPVVILADTVRGRVSESAVLCSERLGIGLNYVDTGRRIKYPALPLKLIRYFKNKDEFAEEMRLLYVALTRAREKLIMICGKSGSSPSKKWCNPAVGTDGKILSGHIESTFVMRDWIILGLLRNKNLGELRGLMESDISELKIDGESAIGFRQAPYEPGTGTGNGNRQAQQTVIEETDEEPDADELEQIINYKYPHEELTKIPLKLSVSEIKNSMRENLDEQDGEYTPMLQSISDRTFHSAEKNNAAERGTITHYVLQHIDPLRTGHPDEIKAQLKELTESGVISQSQLAQVDTGSITALFMSETGAKIRAAAKNGRLEREFKMLFPVKAAEIYGEFEDPEHSGADIIVQGVADCICFEDGGAVLIDYKTDACSAEYAPRQAEKYKVQIEFYTRGIQEILGIRVKERIVYFLTPGTAVSL